MVKRAKFSSEVDIKQEDYDKFLDHTIVKDKLKTGNPMVDLQVSQAHTNVHKGDHPYFSLTHVCVCLCSPTPRLRRCSRSLA